MSSSPLLGAAAIALLVGFRLYMIGRRLHRTARFQAIEGGRARRW